MSFFIFSLRQCGAPLKIALINNLSSSYLLFFSFLFFSFFVLFLVDKSEKTGRGYLKVKQQNPDVNGDSSKQDEASSAKDLSSKQEVEQRKRGEGFANH